MAEVSDAALRFTMSAACTLSRLLLLLLSRLVIAIGSLVSELLPTSLPALGPLLALRPALLVPGVKMPADCVRPVTFLSVDATAAVLSCFPEFMRSRTLERLRLSKDIVFWNLARGPADRSGHKHDTRAVNTSNDGWCTRV
jgi:hypothetical protein